jgi:hypothetical protein
MIVRPTVRDVETARPIQSRAASKPERVAVTVHSIYLARLRQGRRIKSIVTVIAIADWRGVTMANVNQAAYRALLILVFGIFASFAAGTTAFAQAGSVGGTIGNTDKSISGESTATPPVVVGNPKHRQRSGEPSRQDNKQKVFVNPTIDGLPVDRCLTYAANCNEPAASAWCRRKGMTHATGWKYENKTHIGHVVGASAGDHRDCNFGCDGFTEVICE